MMPTFWCVRTAYFTSTHVVICQTYTVYVLYDYVYDSWYGFSFENINSFDIQYSSSSRPINMTSIQTELPLNSAQNGLKTLKERFYLKIKELRKAQAKNLKMIPQVRINVFMFCLFNDNFPSCLPSYLVILGISPLVWGLGSWGPMESR